ncbi:hypothetical protein K7X08_002774 [Anisodus acutangulus]|uniref:Uncharacterized protein n=1 Tax=Anisodus acutangulus TaxID=402998 RepID=A0A9Q1ME63_9SOLA|nr:hypothetical protein K7X08_002774 [Anisodus acutangulus]
MKESKEEWLRKALTTIKQMVERLEKWLNMDGNGDDKVKEQGNEVEARELVDYNYGDDKGNEAQQINADTCQKYDERAKIQEQTRPTEKELQEA